VSAGVYAKANRPATDRTRAVAGVETMAVEVLKKLGRRIRGSTTPSHVQPNHVVIDGGSHRLSRKFYLGQTTIVYSQRKVKNVITQLPKDLDRLPTQQVSEFVQKFAQAHQIMFKRSEWDFWVEAVTRAAGDDIQLDQTGKLLVALKKKRLITGPQMARLLINHLREQKRV
jgi:hypothetical protein